MNFRPFPHEICARRRHAIIIWTQNIATRRGKTARGWLATSIGVNIKGGRRGGKWGSLQIALSIFVRKRRLAGVASCKAGFIELKRKRRREPERGRRRRRPGGGRGRPKSGPLNRSTCNYIDLTVSDDVDLSSKKGARRVDFESFSNFAKEN